MLLLIFLSFCLTKTLQEVGSRHQTEGITWEPRNDCTCCPLWFVRSCYRNQGLCLSQMEHNGCLDNSLSALSKTTTLVSTTHPLRIVEKTGRLKWFLCIATPPSTLGLGSQQLHPVAAANHRRNAMTDARSLCALTEWRALGHPMR